MARKSAERGMADIDSELGFKFNVDLLVGIDIEPYENTATSDGNSPLIPLFKKSGNRLSPNVASKLTTIVQSDDERTPMRSENVSPR
jgi:hypothetical protein